ncbi:hypothetical protein A8C56_20690 [Niabella ginsenosidivorans]|uniref:Glycoside hydrolase family 49 N-terminal domain-containing protein n=1 Tax=Niabella ginsenosidivorans TaxID=1176587 RepID=A0A1A9I5Y1_9BACT|nr:hypothetical protein [Niabella ginsenosidivorans]ANH83078.1 hypothetical protein A8C56_20690 [Niabella ginsenosidivorans]
MTTIRRLLYSNLKLFLGGIMLLLALGCSKISSIDDGNNDNGENPPATDTVSYTGVPQSDIYEVTVIRNGGVRQKQVVFQNACPVYQAGYMNMTTNDMYPLNIFKGRTINWSTFSFSGTITIEVKLLSQSRLTMSSNVTILPSRYGITPAVNGNTITFTLNQPGQCSVEIGANGYKNGLMLFANPAETNKPDTASGSYRIFRNAVDTDFADIGAQYTGIYFRPGVHNMGVFHIPAHIKNVYLAEGAWVYGALIMDGNPDVHIFGRGILSSAKLNYRESHCVEAINQSNNIMLEGITIADQKHFAVRLIGKNNTVSWVKTIGAWTYNCDGIAAYEGSTVSHCFIWANDDNIKIYRNNIRFTDCVCWQLNNGGIIQMSWGNGNATNVTVSRIDILHAEWNNEAVNRGVISCVGDKFAEGGMYGLQKDWVIEDLVTETPVPLIFRVSPNAASPNEIHGLTFKNWNVKMDLSKGFHNYIIAGDPDKPFDGLVFDHFLFNGTQLTAANWITLMNLNVANVQTPTFQ